MGQDEDPVNNFLISYLDAIDEQLLEYIDDDDELKLDAVQRLRFYTSALLDVHSHRTVSWRTGRTGSNWPPPSWPLTAQRNSRGL
ncbi:MAG: hypothetical protein ABSD85_16120 [Acidimicrobiales bacterium]|jgi:hypothetical protein